MLYFDVTRISNYRHHSGLARTSQHLLRRLQGRLGSGFAEVTWHKRRAVFVSATGRKPVTFQSNDWLLTVELFSEEERPGFSAWLHRCPCRAAALYYDAIPLRYPEFTWPHSVARHPGYMKLLARFDRVMAISRASAEELRDYWRWAGAIAPEPRAIVLGADGWNRPRTTTVSPSDGRTDVVTIGILEPRKDQMAILDVAEQLWENDVALRLTLVGRINPHFGRPIAARVRQLRRAGRPVVHVPSMGDDELGSLMEKARFLVMPSIIEGCGLPVLEALWAGVPVLCSDIPPIRENAEGGGCCMVPPGDRAALTEAMQELLRDDQRIAALKQEATTRPLPTWDETVRELLENLK